jgi:hypothetical protein
MKQIQAFQTEVYINKVKYKVHNRALIMLLFHGLLYKCKVSLLNKHISIWNTINNKYKNILHLKFKK